MQNEIFPKSNKNIHPTLRKVLNKATRNEDNIGSLLKLPMIKKDQSGYRYQIEITDQVVAGPIAQTKTIKRK